MTDPTRRLCEVCSDPVDPHTTHSYHEDECPKSHHSGDPDIVCRCDALVHPACCPEPRCQDIGTGLTIMISARFVVPPWFDEEKVHELGQLLVEDMTQRDQALHAGYGPEPVIWDSDDTAYVCAASAEVRAIHHSAMDPASVTLWGHGERCKLCHHLDHDLEDDERCTYEDCDCSGRIAYVPVDDLRGGQS